MPEVTEYTHGIPSWVDLATPDPEASKAFYGALFGWDFTGEATDQPGVDYFMAMKGGQAAAGMMQLRPEMAAAGMPPVWSCYVTVDDVDATAAKVDSAGGAVMQPPMDVMEAGRMAVVTDPGGAVICLWEKKQHIGAGVVNEHGAFTWCELVTPDPAKVADFYAQVFGWTAQTMPMPEGEYTVFFVEGGNPNGVAGAMVPPMEGMPSFWGIYFAVDDYDSAVAAATTNGATLLAGPMEVEGVGRFGALMDPQGAMFSVMQSAS